MTCVVVRQYRQVAHVEDTTKLQDVSVAMCPLALSIYAGAVQACPSADFVLDGSIPRKQDLVDEGR